jgi:hypothetical protein
VKEPNVKNPDGLTVVPIKRTFIEWGYVIVDVHGRQVASGYSGPNGGPLVRKGAARAAGEHRLKMMRKNQKRIDKAARKRR